MKRFVTLHLTREQLETIDLAPGSAAEFARAVSREDHLTPAEREDAAEKERRFLKIRDTIIADAFWTC